MEFKVDTSGKYVEFHLHLVRAKNKNRLELANVNEIVQRKDGNIIRLPVKINDKTKSSTGKTGTKHFKITHDGNYEIKLEGIPFKFFMLKEKQ